MSFNISRGRGEETREKGVVSEKREGETGRGGGGGGGGNR